ncbi:MAG TPA: hypothetical protein VEL78_00165 [Pyrinomonadaceae bacterium]|nr:hypothetical protein [Pyrinomonadaceae bacterium]
MKFRLFLFTAILFAISAITAISFAQRTRDEKPISGDFKITFKQNMGGQEMQSTTMIKGLRERNETSMNMAGMPAGMNMGQVTITECDLKRTIQINDRARKYMIVPMETDSGEGVSSADMGPSTSGGSRRGGVVTMTINTVDTGERKEMFGFTARHLKQTMMSQSSPDACQQQNMKIERDGWYINLEYGLNCGSERPPQMGRTTAPQGCRDRYQFKHTGPSNLGFPLIETTTIYGTEGSAMTTMTKEVVELSRQPLDAAIFDVPAGYTEAKSQQEMYAAPSMAEIMAMSRQQSGETSSGQPSMGMPSTSTATARAKVGVVEFNNKAKASVSTDSLRQQLIATLNGDGIDAIALNASSPSEAAIEAKAKGCTYILYTDISTFKAPSTGKKIGGLLGRATGVGSGEVGKAEAKLDYRLVPVGSTSPKLQSSASGKEETSDASVNAALQDEARAVVGAVGGN